MPASKTLSLDGLCQSSVTLANILLSKLTPQLLKPAVTEALCDLLAPIQEEYLKNTELQEIAKKAYPPPPEVKKKEKKAKNPGTRYPNAKKEVVAKADGQVEGNASEGESCEGRRGGVEESGHKWRGVESNTDSLHRR